LEQRGRGPRDKAVRGRGSGFESLGELASMIGLRSILLFSLMGMSIESYNMKNEDRVSASAADFISTLKELNAGFDSLVIEGDQRVMLLLIGKVGEMEVYELTVGEPGAALEAEDIRGLLRVYLSASMRRRAQWPKPGMSLG